MTKCGKLCDQIGELLDEDGDGEYLEEDGTKEVLPFCGAWLAAYLLEEIEDPGGAGLAGAVDAAGFTLGRQTLRDAGISLDDRRIDADVIDEIGLPVWQAAKKAYKIAEQLGDGPVRRDAFVSISIGPPMLPSRLEPLARSSVRRKRSPSSKKGKSK
jgi:hypothetical protein